MNVVQRLAIKLAWRQLGGKVGKQALKTWGPVIGGVLTIGIALARAWGHGEIADAAEAVGGITGVSTQSPVSGQEATATVVAILGALGYAYGVFKKIRGSVEVARLPPAEKAEVKALEARVDTVKAVAKLEAKGQG